MIEICNLKKETPLDQFTDFRVDRTTALGNSYIIGRWTRVEVLFLYKANFTFRLKTEPLMKIHFDLIVGAYRHLLTIESEKHIRLFCWCFPLPCHAEIIRDAIEERVHGEV